VSVVSRAKKSPYKIAFKSVNGPTSYSAGGFTVTIDGLREIVHAIVELRQRGNNYRIDYSWSGNTVTIKVYVIAADTSSGDISATEVADGTDLSGLTFDIIAIGI